MHKLRVASLFLSVVMLVGAADVACAGPIGEFMAGRVSIGARYTRFVFTDNTARNYNENGEFTGGFTVGISIDELAEIQHDHPLLYARFKATDYVSLEMAWEQMKGDAITYWDGHTDGVLDVSGVSLQVLGTLPNTTRFTPYGGAGIAILNGEFDHAPWGQGEHIIGVDNGYGFLATAGCSAEIWGGLSLDASVRYMKAELDSYFYLNRGGYTSNHFYWTFPLENWAWQLGLRYTF